MIDTSKVLSAATLLLAFSSALSAAPRLALSTATVGPVNIQTGANGVAQTIQAYNYGDGTLSLTASSSASWLAATVGAQTACSQAPGGCYPISIALNTASLAPGSYTEYISLNSPGAIDAPQEISVSVTTTGVPSSITAYLTPAGGGAATNSFPVYALGTGLQGAVTTSSGGSWLQFLNTANSIVPTTQPYVISVNALAAMTPGTYTGTVTITGSTVASDNKIVSVTAIVTASPIISPTANANVLLNGYVGGSAQTATVSLINEAAGTSLSVSAAAGSAAWLTASVSGSVVTITATPGTMAAGLYKGAVTLTSNAANNAQIAIPVEFTVAPAGTPSISFGGLVNGADFTPTSVSPGDIVALFGQQLAPSTMLAPSTPLATTLAGTQVLVNGTPAPLFFVSSGQINFQMPYGLTAGQVVPVQVMSGAVASNIRSVTVATYAPRLLSFSAFITGGYGVIVNNVDGSLPLPSGTNVPGFLTHPAKPGDVLTIYGIGFGQTNPAATAGLAASSTTLQSVSNVTSVFGGGPSVTAVPATPSFAGLTPTAVGLYQVNVTVPALAPNGLGVAFMVSVNGTQSNTVYLAISANGK